MKKSRILAGLLLLLLAGLHSCSLVAMRNDGKGVGGMQENQGLEPAQQLLDAVFRVVAAGSSAAPGPGAVALAPAAVPPVPGELSKREQFVQQVVNEANKKSRVEELIRGLELLVPLMPRAAGFFNRAGPQELAGYRAINGFFDYWLEVAIHEGNVGERILKSLENFLETMCYARLGFELFSYPYLCVPSELRERWLGGLKSVHRDRIENYFLGFCCDVLDTLKNPLRELMDGKRADPAEVDDKAWEEYLVDNDLVTRIPVGLCKGLLCYCRKRESVTSLPKVAQLSVIREFFAAKKDLVLNYFKLLVGYGAVVRDESAAINELKRQIQNFIDLLQASTQQECNQMLTCWSNVLVAHLGVYMLQLEEIALSRRSWVRESQKIIKARENVIVPFEAIVRSEFFQEAHYKSPAERENFEDIFVYYVTIMQRFRKNLFAIEIADERPLSGRERDEMRAGMVALLRSCTQQAKMLKPGWYYCSCLYGRPKAEWQEIAVAFETMVETLNAALKILAEDGGFSLDRYVKETHKLIKSLVPSFLQ